MVVTAEEAANAYRIGITLIGGAEKYKECRAKKGAGFLAVAKCLQDAHDAKVLTTEGMVSKYKAKAGSGG